MSRPLFQVPLSDRMISDYTQPEGTRDCGTNCSICTLSMLGFLDKSRVVTGTDLCIVKQSVPLVRAIKSANNYITEVLGKDYGLEAIPVTKDVAVGLNQMIDALKYGNATVLYYGTENAAHVVVLRKSPTGKIELIDPQRGQSDIDKQYGFTQARVKELSLVVTPHYYKATGLYNITRVMLEQSLKFNYATTEEELYSKFVISAVTMNQPSIEPKPEFTKEARFVGTHPITGKGKTKRRLLRKRLTRRIPNVSY